LARLARETSVLTFAPSEIAPLQNQYVVARGMVLYGSAILRSGAVWGDDVILSEPRYFSKKHARAISYVDTMMLNRDTLMQVIGLFPASKARLRLMMIKLALRRHVVEAARCQCTHAGDLFNHASNVATVSKSFFGRMDKDRADIQVAIRRDGDDAAPKSKRELKRLEKEKEKVMEEERGEESRRTVLTANQMPQAQWKDTGDAPLEDDKHTQLMHAMDELNQKLILMQKQHSADIISMQKQHSADMERLYRHLQGTSSTGLVGGASATVGSPALPSAGSTLDGEVAFGIPAGVGAIGEVGVGVGSIMRAAPAVDSHVTGRETLYVLSPLPARPATGGVTGGESRPARGQGAETNIRIGESRESEHISSSAEFDLSEFIDAEIAAEGPAGEQATEAGGGGA
jgi:hypothetical protein